MWRTLEALRNWDGRSEIADVRLPDVILGNITYENILRIRVLKLSLILIGWNLSGQNKWEGKDSRDSFVDVFLSQDRKLPS